MANAIMLKDKLKNYASDITPLAGYITSSGGISSQTSTSKEVYYEEYFTIDFFNSNIFLYEKNQGDDWAGIALYDADKTFLERITEYNPVISQTNEKEVCVFYRGRSEIRSDAEYVRLTHRTYGYSKLYIFDEEELLSLGD